MNWLEQPKITCPDCGAVLGNTSLDGTIQIFSTIGMGDPAKCIHVGTSRSSKPQCPRMLEAIEAANQSHNK